MDSEKTNIYKSNDTCAQGELQENGNETFFVQYNDDGSVKNKNEYKYKYDENSNLQFAYRYDAEGNLESETEYINPIIVYNGKK